MALNRPAIVPISSSRSARITRDEIALADGVDPLQQASQRPHHDLLDREAHADRHPDDHQEEKRIDPAGGGRHLGVDVAGVAPHPHDRRRVARRVARRQLERGGVEQRDRHRVRARPRRGIEQAADGRVLDVGRAHQQQPGVVVRALLAADRQHLQRNSSSCWRAAPRAGQQHLFGRSPDRAARYRRAARWRSRALRDRDPPPGSRAAP